MCACVCICVCGSARINQHPTPHFQSHIPIPRPALRCDAIIRYIRDHCRLWAVRPAAVMSTTRLQPSIFLLRHYSRSTPQTLIKHSPRFNLLFRSVVCRIVTHISKSCVCDCSCCALPFPTIHSHSRPTRPCHRCRTSPSRS